MLITNEGIISRCNLQTQKLFSLDFQPSCETKCWKSTQIMCLFEGKLVTRRTLS